MSTDGIYDKSKWPLQTSDMFWALSDVIEDIAQLEHKDDSFAEYIIDLEDLPEASLALWNLNALRHVRLSLNSFPGSIRSKLKAASLHIGSKAIERITIKPSSDSANFSIFSGEHVLPLFIMKNEKMSVRIEFNGLSEDDQNKVPYKCIDADALLVRIKTMKNSFFVAACAQSIITYDGTEVHVQCANDRTDRDHTLFPGCGQESEQSINEQLIDERANMIKAFGHSITKHFDLDEDLALKRQISPENIESFAHLRNALPFDLETPKDPFMNRLGLHGSLMNLSHGGHGLGHGLGLRGPLGAFMQESTDSSDCESPDHTKLKSPRPEFNLERSAAVMAEAATADDTNKCEDKNDTN